MNLLNLLKPEKVENFYTLEYANTQRVSRSRVYGKVSVVQRQLPPKAQSVSTSSSSNLKAKRREEEKCCTLFKIVQTVPTSFQPPPTLLPRFLVTLAAKYHTLSNELKKKQK